MNMAKTQSTKAPRLLIAAPHGRSGKTVITMGLCTILRKEGLNVQPFKKGPDYIDPSWLSASAGSPCRNLDPFLVTEERLKAYFSQSCQKTDIALVEGAMGLYDGVDPDGKWSSAHLARLLGTPVILVINTSMMARSAAAMINGFKHFEDGINIAGVILNNVAGKRHETKLRTAIEEYCGVPILGVIPRNQNLAIRQRHLGLVPFEENGQATSVVEHIYGTMKECFDIKNLLTIAGQAMPLAVTKYDTQSTPKRNIKIGVIRDQAFNFYYLENLDALVQNGAELVYINSLRDQNLPEIQGLYIGGGFPELFLEELENNASLRYKIADLINSGLPVYAECAGLVYLCTGLRHLGRLYQMVGIIPAEVELSSRPFGHGYIISEVIRDNPWFSNGTILKGHEFHYSRVNEIGDLDFAFKVVRGYGINGHVDGVLYKNIFASYMHINALGTPEWAIRFIALAAKYASKKKRTLAHSLKQLD
jgi:cobyrinic acid a,c-diamide synthase